MMTPEKKSSRILSIPSEQALQGDGSDSVLQTQELESEPGDLVELRELTIDSKHHGMRLDQVLAQAVPEFSRSYLQQLIGAHQVQRNGVQVSKPSIKVHIGEHIQIELRPTPQSQAFKAQAMALDVVYEDDALLVINKPVGLVVHPAPGHWSGTLLNGLLAYDEQAMFVPRAGIVHRLDKDTSGLMVVARQRAVMDRLVQMLSVRSVSRQYVALAHRAWQGPHTRQVNTPIGRDPRNRLRMAVVDLDKHSGKSAMTDITLIQTSEQFCRVQCKLHTGRTHQIRVHMASMGHPLVADELYGGSSAGGLLRQALHAERLAFEHPITGQSLEFTAAPPADFQAAMTALALD